MAGAGGKRARQERARVRNGHGGSPKSEESPPSSGSPTDPSQSLPGPLDGNRDPARRGSNASASASAQRAGPVAALKTLTIANKNLDLGALVSYRTAGFPTPSHLSERTALNNTGKPVNVALNTHHVTAFPTQPVYQYDVQIGKGDETRAVNRKAWGSQEVRDMLGQGWIYDGNKLAFSMKSAPNKPDTDVNMDVVNQRGPRTDRKTGAPKPAEIIRVAVRRPHKISFDVLSAWLAGKADWDDSCFEAINFLDHLLRELPSQRFIQIKRNFFARGDQRSLLGGGLEAMKGVYASIRVVNSGLKTPGVLSVNIDVANGTFWSPINVVDTVRLMLNARDQNQAVVLLRLDKNGKLPPAANVLRRFKKVRVFTDHREKADHYTIDSLSTFTAKTKKMLWTDPKTNKEENISINDYFYKKYNKRLILPDLPLLQMTKKGTLVPMEICFIEDNQRYPYKLSDVQTSAMIKFAVTLPRDRLAAIDHGLRMLDWGNDQYLAKYGLKINPQRAQAQGRVLPNPQVQFGSGLHNPGTTGRWDLKGKKFLGIGRAIQSWGIAVIKGRGQISPEQVKAFLNTFISVLASHGIVVQNKDPPIIPGAENGARTAELVFNAAGNAVKMRPQLLVFIVPNKDSETYQRIKKSCDCRFGVASQVLQSAHVAKAQAQYCSNVAMKVNAKLGGMTARAHGMKGGNNWFTKPTMVIGADVSHGSPGSDAASIAAITVSWDQQAIRYAAAVETNGSRVEIITNENWVKMFKPLAQTWYQNIGRGNWPQVVYYFRDGVSEGQYSHVLEGEVKSIKAIFKELNPKSDVKITVLICSKRHHIRFFPTQNGGDRNGNPLPGTLVETHVTHTRENDYYMCAHSAIKGTARPVHYHTLMDEQNLKPEQIQNFIYEASYQYVRSTTPVSLYPAIYYAHLAAARATSHINVASDSGPEASRISSKATDEVAPLLPINTDKGDLNLQMWYV